MKKLILKTALITFGVTLILAVSLFGIVSFCAPASMMRFFDSIGLENISGDYAYQEYQNTKDINYLVRAFEIAAANGNDSIAEERFEELYGEEGSERRAAFADYCALQQNASLPDGVPDYNVREYLCGRAVCVKYRLAKTDEEKSEVVDFAFSESESRLTSEGTVVSLAVEAIESGDEEFCAFYLGRIRDEEKFDPEDGEYVIIINHLEGVGNE